MSCDDLGFAILYPNSLHQVQWWQVLGNSAPFDFTSISSQQVI